MNAHGFISPTVITSSGSEEWNEMGRIGRGWKLAKMSLGIIRKDKEILIFPILSGLVTMIILASFLVGAFFSVGFDGLANGSSSWIFYAFFAVFYFVSFFVAIFFNACVIGCATIRLNGGDPTVKDGFRIAMDNIGRIAAWALFAATIGLIIRTVQQRVGFIGKLIMGALGVAWTVVTYFVVPVLIYEKLGPWGSVKRSASILRKTWGEALVGNLGLGLIFFLFGILGIIPIILGAIVGGLVGAIVGIVVAVVYWLIIGIIASAAEAILVAALYRYATTGKVSEDFDGSVFAQPWAAR
jgi:hypothetical protein